jgi:hypothetical protein
MKGINKNIMGAPNVNIWVGENKMSYSRINGSENDFMPNLYDPWIVNVQQLFTRKWFMWIY